MWLFSNYRTRPLHIKCPTPTAGGGPFRLGHQRARCRQTDQPLIVAAERSPRAWDCWKSLSVLLFNPYNSAGRWLLVEMRKRRPGERKARVRACRAAQPWRWTQAASPPPALLPLGKVCRLMRCGCETAALIDGVQGRRPHLRAPLSTHPWDERNRG